MKKKVLDVTNFKCPMTFLKTKEFIKLNTNSKKIITEMKSLLMILLQC